MITSLSELVMLSCGDDYIDLTNDPTFSTINDSCLKTSDSISSYETVVIENPFETSSQKPQCEKSNPKDHSQNQIYSITDCFSQSQPDTTSGYVHDIHLGAAAELLKEFNYCNNLDSVWNSSQSQSYDYGQGSYDTANSPARLPYGGYQCNTLSSTRFNNPCQNTNSETTANNMPTRGMLTNVSGHDQNRHYNEDGRWNGNVCSNYNQIYSYNSLIFTSQSRFNHNSTLLSRTNPSYSSCSYQSCSNNVAPRYYSSLDLEQYQVYSQGGKFAYSHTTTADNHFYASQKHDQTLQNVDSFQAYSFGGKSCSDPINYQKRDRCSELKLCQNSFPKPTYQGNQLDFNNKDNKNVPSATKTSKSTNQCISVNQQNLNKADNTSDSTTKYSPVHVISLRQLNCESGRKHFWSEAETKCLLTVFRRPEIQMALGRLSKRHSTWRLTADLMRRYGYPRTARQCRQKLARLLGPEVTDQRKQAALYANTRLPSYSHYYQQQRDRANEARDSNGTLGTSQKTYPIGILRKPRDPERDFLAEGPPVTSRRVHWRDVHIYIESNTEWPTQIDLTIPLYHLHPESG